MNKQIRIDDGTRAILATCAKRWKCSMTAALRWIINGIKRIEDPK